MTIKAMRIIKPASENGGWPRWTLTAPCAKCQTVFTDTVSGHRMDIYELLDEERWRCPRYQDKTR